MTERKMNWRSRGDHHSAAAPFGWTSGGWPDNGPGGERGPSAVSIHYNHHGKAWAVYIDGQLTKVSAPDRDKARVLAAVEFWRVRDAWDSPQAVADRADKARWARLDGEKLRAERVAVQRVREAAPDLLKAANALIDVISSCTEHEHNRFIGPFQDFANDELVALTEAIDTAEGNS